MAPRQELGTFKAQRTESSVSRLVKKKREVEGRGRQSQIP